MIPGIRPTTIPRHASNCDTDVRQKRSLVGSPRKNAKINSRTSPMVKAANDVQNHAEIKPITGLRQYLVTTAIERQLANTGIIVQQANAANTRMYSMLM